MEGVETEEREGRMDGDLSVYVLGLRNSCGGIDETPLRPLCRPPNPRLLLDHS